MPVPQGIQVPFQVDKTLGSPVIANETAFFNSSIRMILNTVPGERRFNPTFGSWLTLIMFANMTEGAAFQAVSEARRALREWEPRITVQDILFDIADNQIFLTVVYRPNGAAASYRTTVEFRT